MTDIQLITSVVEKRQAYVDLGISNLWAAHLIALSTRYPKHKDYIAKAINPNEPTLRKNAPSRFVDTSPKKPAKDNFGLCADCPQPIEAPPKDVKEDVFKTIADVQAVYTTRDALVRAAIQLNLKPHHKASDAKIAADILDALNSD